MSRYLSGFRIWLVLMVIALSLSGTAAFAQGGTLVRVDPPVSSPQLNDSFTLSVKVDNIANLSALELHLSFNPAVLEVISVTNGGFVAADFVAQNTFDNAAGTIDYAVAQINRSPAQGSGALLNIAFLAKANGSSNLTLRATQAAPTGLLLSDPNGMSIPASWQDGSVTVGSLVTITATPVTPAPATSTPLSPTPGPSTTPVTPVGPTATPVTPVGPTATSIPPTPTPVVTVPPPVYGGVLGTHVVRFGESLYCIGRAYKVTPWAIAKANGIWWPYIIFPSQKLTITNIPWIPVPAGPVCQSQINTPPPGPTPVPSPTLVPVTPGPTPVPSLTPVPPPSICRAYYVVRWGDTLYRIATMYGIRYEDIARVNNIPNPRLIYPGQQLCIP